MLSTPLLRSLVCAILVFSGSVVHALGVRPMVSELQPIGSNARTALTVYNDGDSVMTIEASPLSMALSLTGEETLTPADDDIIVFPPTAIIQPGQSQVLQVQYIGDPEISVSRVYRVQIEQLSVAMDKKTAAVQVNFKMNTILHVAPVASESSLVVNSITSGAESGVSLIEVANTGNRYAAMYSSSWVISSGDNTLQLDSAELETRLDGNLVLPNQTRVLQFKVPEGIDLQNASIEILSR